MAIMGYWGFLPFAAVAVGVATGCANFTSSDQGTDGGGPVVDGGADGALPPVTGRAAEAPGPPAEVVAEAIPVVVAVSTLAGTAGAAAYSDAYAFGARFNAPQGIAVDATGNLFVSDTGNQRIRKVTPGAIVTTVAGSGTAALADGTGAAASFSGPQGLVVGKSGAIYVSDTDNNCVRQVSPGGVVTTLAGDANGDYLDATGRAARFNVPGGVAVDGTGKLFVTDVGNSRIRAVTPAGVVTTLAGSGEPLYADGIGTAASFSSPLAIAVGGPTIYVADTLNHRVRAVTTAGKVTTLSGSGAGAFADGEAKVASFLGPSAIAADARGNVYVGDGARLRRITPAGAVSTLAGSSTAGDADGSGATASFRSPSAIALAADGTIYVADAVSHTIRKVAVDGVGRLKATWKNPATTGGAPITKFVATATAPGQPAKTCTTAAATSCTFEGLTSGIAYTVLVSAINDAGAGKPSSPVVATVN